MQGFPPSADRQVNNTNAFHYPYMRWAFRHTRELSPTAGIRRSARPQPMPVQSVKGLDLVSFELDGKTIRIDEYLRQTHTDGFIVLHEGRIVYERYFDGFGVDQLHIWASMTKSLTGLLAAMLVDEGKLDPQATLSTYVPELAGTPFGDATVQQNLDMEVAVAYPEHLPPDLALFGAVGILPRREGAPDSIYAFLKVPIPAADKTGGDVWYYQNGSPEAVAWALRRITGKSWAQLVSERIWSHFAEDDASVQIDRLGTEMASGGFSSTLRDAARFAEFVRLAQAQRLPGHVADAVRIALQPGRNQARFARGNLAAGRQGYAYRDYWYQRNDGDGSVEAGGRFGQKIYINPRRALTIVKFSSNPDTAPRATSAGDNRQAAAPRRLLESSETFALAAQAIYGAIAR
ncbi:6-aminohexanoate-dimer hydrolase [Cupriavidus yeoncheonensis]|uniref:6-aminohexanoate-dimer hydrolase n=2 Tax=Cupriavidus yeoncheonensis TaxID=1462994 RepID=A0A916ISL5_9BURK|nr:6-aminohexanoate-dimer hydrolase [Cupriavidus yeoncheonensis]